MKNKQAAETRLTDDKQKQQKQARIATISNRRAQILLDGEQVPCLLPGSQGQERGTLAVGDRVEAEEIEGGQFKLVRVLPRETAVYRGDRRTADKTILVAANVQLVLAVVTAEYLLHQAGYLEMAAIAAQRAGVRFGVFVSKWDLIGENARQILQGRLERYRLSADFLIAGSALEPQEELAGEIRGKAVLLVGDRSCGKTTLINGILYRPGSENGGRTAATHTSALYPGADGTLLIDTPGFRDFCLRAVTAKERDTVFPEIAPLAKKCPFSDCSHTHEEGCAVLQSLREKQIARERYDAYQKMAGKSPREDTAKPDYRRNACVEPFTCKVCGTLVLPEGAGSRHRNHCPHCLSSIHLDNEPGDRAALCGGVMDPVSVWVRKDGEWAVIHRCRVCGALHSNRAAADDNPALLLSIAVKPLAKPPFPLDRLEQIFSH